MWSTQPILYVSWFNNSLVTTEHTSERNNFIARMSSAWLSLKVMRSGILDMHIVSSRCWFLCKKNNILTFVWIRKRYFCVLHHVQSHKYLDLSRFLCVSIKSWAKRCNERKQHNRSKCTASVIESSTCC